jgi:predicted nucleic acid-binding protein
MPDRVFLDTNVFVYLYDSDNPDKQARARALLDSLSLSGTLFVSTQVLQELYVTVTRKFATRLTEDEILLATRTLSTLPVVRVSVEMIFSAIELVRRLHLSFWDGLILQAAQKAGCTLLISEDLQHGQRIGNLRIENPFL